MPKMSSSTPLQGAEPSIGVRAKCHCLIGYGKSETVETVALHAAQLHYLNNRMVSSTMVNLMKTLIGLLLDDRIWPYS